MASRVAMRCFLRTARRTFPTGGSTQSSKTRINGSGLCSRSVSSTKPVRSQALRRVMLEPTFRLPVQVTRVGNAGLRRLLILECLMNVDGKDRYNATSKQLYFIFVNLFQQFTILSFVDDDN